MYKSNFHEVILEVIDSITSEFNTGLKYIYDAASSGHFFQIIEEKIWLSENFQEYKSTKIFNLLEDGFYEGIAFLGPNDNTISFNQADIFGAKQVKSLNIEIQAEQSYKYIVISDEINWWVKDNEKISLDDVFDPIKYHSLEDITSPSSEQIPMDKKQAPFSNNTGNNNHAMAA